MKYLDLWPSDIQKVHSSEILVNIWSSEPRAAETKVHYFGSKYIYTSMRGSRGGKGALPPPPSPQNIAPPNSEARAKRALPPPRGPRGPCPPLQNPGSAYDLWATCRKERSTILDALWNIVDLWAMRQRERSTTLDLLLNIWRSKPRPLEKGPKFCIFF